MNNKPHIGEVRPAGWFVDRTHYQIARGWKLVEFRRCYTNPNDPVQGERWKPVWRYHA